MLYIHWHVYWDVLQNVFRAGDHSWRHLNAPLPSPVIRQSTLKLLTHQSIVCFHINACITHFFIQTCPSIRVYLQGWVACYAIIQAGLIIVAAISWTPPLLLSLFLVLLLVVSGIPKFLLEGLLCRLESDNCTCGICYVDIRGSRQTVLKEQCLSFVSEMTGALKQPLCFWHTSGFHQRHNWKGIFCFMSLQMESHQPPFIWKPVSKTRAEMSD